MNGWNLLLKVRVFLSIPCAASAALKRRKVIIIEIHVKSDVMVVSVWNQLKTYGPQMPQSAHV